MGDPANPTDSLYIENELLYEEANGLYSGMRTEYIEMRKEARDFYKSAEIISFGLVFNHILSAIDAQATLLDTHRAGAPVNLASCHCSCHSNCHGNRSRR